MSLEQGILKVSEAHDVTARTTVIRISGEIHALSATTGRGRSRALSN
jgi:hypothetical protein